jgi:hypothetical protein
VLPLPITPLPLLLPFDDRTPLVVIDDDDGDAISGAEVEEEDDDDNEVGDGDGEGVLVFDSRRLAANASAIFNRGPIAKPISLR